MRDGRGKTDTYLGEHYRRIPRRRGKQKAIVATARAILEIACILIADRAARFSDLGADYYSRVDPARQTRDKIRELERLNPGMKVTLTPAGRHHGRLSHITERDQGTTRYYRSCHQHSPYPRRPPPAPGRSRPGGWLLPSMRWSFPVRSSPGAAQSKLPAASST